MRDRIKPKGTVHFYMTDDKGQVKLDKTVRNLVVNTGLNYIVDRLIGATPAEGPISHIAVGTGVIGEAAGDTAMGTLLGTLRALDSTTDNGDSTITYQATFLSGEATWSGAITEAGLFNGATNGVDVMMARTTFSAINKGDNDTLVITWTIDFNAV